MSECPFCPPNGNPKIPVFDCVLNKPLWMVIPPQGIHLPCPAHHEGHHIHGPTVTYSMGDAERGGR